MYRPSKRIILAASGIAVSAAIGLGLTAATAAPTQAPAPPGRGAQADSAEEGCYPHTTGGYTHPFGYPQPDADDVAEKGFHAVIEMPDGSFTKYEVDADTGLVIADRFQSMPVAYPGNYGSISQSMGGDGDPLDVLVLTRAPLHPGTVIQVRAIGVLKMIDDGEEDDKVIAVPMDKIDPDYTETVDIDDLPKLQVQRIEAFFRVYKDLPEGRKKVELDGFRDRKEATRMVSSAIATYQSHCG